MSISVEPDLFGNLTLGASCTGCAGVHNAPDPDDEAYGSSPDLSGPVEIDFIYNSNSAENGPFGYGRTLTCNFYLKFQGDQATITRGNGSSSKYTRGERLISTSSSGSDSESGSAAPAGSGQTAASGQTRYDAQKVGSRNQLTRSDDNTWIETAPDGRQLVFVDALEGQLNRLSYAEDSVGNRHSFTYSQDAKQLLTKITDAYGRLTTLNYNPEGTLLGSITDFADRTTSFDYDVDLIAGKPLLTKITGPTGCETSYEYTATAALTAVTDPNGCRTEYGYDSQRRVIWRNIVGAGTNKDVDRYSYEGGSVITNVMGETLSFETDINGKVVAGTNAKVVAGTNGEKQRRTIVRDANGWATARQDMTGATRYTDYNGRGDVTKITDPIGHRTRFERDAYGNATKITYDDDSFVLMDWGAGAQAARRRLLKHTDELSNETTYTYDEHGKVLSVTDALDKATTMEYDAFGRMIRSTDALDQVTHFGYDAADNLTSRVDPLQHTWSYEYDLADRLTKSTDSENGVMQFGYDAGGNLNLQIDEVGGYTRTKHNAFDLPTEQVEQLNDHPGAADRVTRWEYDKAGRQTAQVVTVNGVEQRTAIEINELGQVAATIDALGRRTETLFDANNRPVQTKDALNGRISKGYNGANWLTTIVDAIGRRTEMGYDKRGRVLTTTQVMTNPADNVTTAVEYDAKGQVTAQVDKLGKRTLMEYDEVGRVTSVTDADGNRTEMEYDAIGQQTAQVDALGNRTAMEYDAAGRHVATVEAVGTLNYRTQMDYDKVGRLLATTDANGSVTRKEYDAKGQQVADMDARGRRTSVEYDKLGRQTAIVDALSHRTEMTYDEADQLLSRRDALGNMERFTYDKVGNQITRLDGRNQLTTYTYDALNRLTKEQLTGNTAITFTYDAMGQQLTMTDQSGTTTNTYDALGRVSSETNGRGNRLAYEYDKAGRRVAMVDPESGRTTYSYADNGWLTQLKDPQNGVTVYTHDKLGRELTKTLPNSVVTTHVYNEVGYETLLEERDALGRALSSYATTYNKVGMKMSVTEKDGSSTSVVNYRYYLTYELAREERVGNGAYLIEYFYDAAGNHLRTVRDGAETTTYCDAANQITRKVGPNGTVNFAYDADGNLSSETAPDGSGKSYVFDGQDQLVAVEMKNAGGALFHRSEFSYDAFGRLVESTEFERSGTAWAKQSERGRVFDGLDTVQERSETNQVVAQLTRDGNIGGILSRKAGASTSFFGYDGNGNVTTLSDAQGNSVGNYRYDGFGNALEVSGSVANENTHRFSTKELHAPSGLYYYGFRFYSLVLSRWINRDPIREIGGVNLYQMVGNNPVNLVDAYGWKERLGGQGGQIVNKSSESILVLFDTGSSKNKNRVVWKLWVPKGYKTNPYVADIDYVQPPADRREGEPWVHLIGNRGGKLSSRFWDVAVPSRGPGLRSYTGCFILGVSVANFEVPEILRPDSKTWQIGKLRPLTEGIDSETGLPQDMVAGSPVRIMSLQQALAMKALVPLK